VGEQVGDSGRGLVGIDAFEVEDLGNPENALPKELRANLISIGLWLLREAEEVRQGRSDNFEGLIEVSQIIRDGIQ
jgi:flagellar protein FlaF